MIFLPAIQQSTSSLPKHDEEIRVSKIRFLPTYKNNSSLSINSGSLKKQSKEENKIPLQKKSTILDTDCDIPKKKVFTNNNQILNKLIQNAEKQKSSSCINLPNLDTMHKNKEPALKNLMNASLIIKDHIEEKANQNNNKQLCLKDIDSENQKIKQHFNQTKTLNMKSVSTNAKSSLTQNSLNSKNIECKLNDKHKKKRSCFLFQCFI
jgi:hypothetical protein